MKILLIHNSYRERGGEDSVFEVERAMLVGAGMSVDVYHVESRRQDSVWGHLLLPITVIWSMRSFFSVLVKLAGKQFDVVHVHNTLPYVSPSVFWAARLLGVPVVYSLHNFRLLCLGGSFSRQGGACTQCLGRGVLKGVRNKCYRNSYLASLSLYVATTFHRLVGTYSRNVSMYLVPSEFVRSLFVRAGTPEFKIRVKPNPVEISLSPTATVEKVYDFLIVSRLSEDKGVLDFLNAAKRLPSARCAAIGTGPLAEALKSEGVHYLGPMAREQVAEYMAKAKVVVAPSRLQETFGLVLLEAHSAEVPVIASRVGAYSELVREGVTGLMFEPGNDLELTDKMVWALANPEIVVAMGRNARSELLERHNRASAVRMLIDAYQSAAEL